MKYSIVIKLIILLSILLIDFGLHSLYKDSAYRGYEIIQKSAFVFAYSYPLALFAVFFKKVSKYLIVISIALALFCLFYFTVVYGTEALFGTNLVIYTVAFGVVIVLLSWVLFFDKKKLIVNK